MLGHSRAVAVVTDANGADVIGSVRNELSGLREVISVDSRTDAAGESMTLEELAERSSGPPIVSCAHDDLTAILYTSGTTGKTEGGDATRTATSWSTPLRAPSWCR